MTLCIAWKNGGAIKFASDSRLSVSGAEYSDIAIKVMDVPVVIKNPTSSETGITDTIYNYKLGMCFCGDTINAYVIKETIYEALQHLQVLPGHTDFSLKSICKVIAKFFEHTSDQLRNGSNWDPQMEFLIGGFCPEQNDILVYKFELVDYNTHYKAMIDEVLVDDGDMIIMGSGTDKAAENISINNIPVDNQLLKVLRDVCNDDTEPSVGGFIQYGHFKDYNFKILGVEDYAVDSDGNIEYIFAYRGTVMYKDKFERADDDFHMYYTFIRPFEDDINELWRKKGID
ncbi:hypothetical protein [Ferruginibacter sp.]